MKTTEQLSFKPCSVSYKGKRFQAWPIMEAPITPRLSRDRPIMLRCTGPLCGVPPVILALFPVFIIRAPQLSWRLSFRLLEQLIEAAVKVVTKCAFLVSGFGLLHFHKESFMVQVGVFVLWRTYTCNLFMGQASTSRWAVSRCLKLLTFKVFS